MSTFNSADIAAFNGGVWVFCEQRQGTMMPTSFELISEGRKLADELGTKLYGILLGHNIEGIAKELGGYGADGVYVCDHPLLENYTTDGYTKVICDTVMEYKPEVMLIGATNIGRDLGPRCAALQGCSNANCCLRRAGSHCHNRQTNHQLRYAKLICDTGRTVYKPVGAFYQHKKSQCKQQ